MDAGSVSEISTVLKLLNQNISQVIQEMQKTRVFEPAVTGAALISCTTTSQSAQLGTGNQVRLSNFGTDAVHVAFGDSTAAATTSDMAILPSTVEVFAIPASLIGQAQRPYLAARANSATSSLSISTGNGA